MTTHGLGEASIVNLIPKASVMNPWILYQAKKAVIKEWEWPADISDQDFLDNFLILVLAKFGIIIDNYIVLPMDGQPVDESDPGRYIRSYSSIYDPEPQEEEIDGEQYEPERD